MDKRRMALAAGLGLWLALGSACSSKQEKAQAYVEEAAGLRQAGSHREALIVLRKALKLDPSSTQINLEIAKTYQEMGEIGEAGFFFGEAYRLDPTNSAAALSKIPSMMEKDPDGAQALIDEVLEREPGNSLAYVRRAELALVRVNVDEALRAALTAVELEPGKAINHRILATVYRAMIREKQLRGQEVPQNVFESALASLRRANEIDDGAWWDRRDIALTYSDWGRTDDARQAWREAFEVAKQHQAEGGMRIVAAGALQFGQAIGDREFVRWALERSLEVDPDSVVALTRLSALVAQEGGSGDEVWTAALERLPDDPRIHAGYGSHLARSGRQEEAIRYLENVPSSVAGSSEVGLLLIDLQLVSGNTEGAQAAMARLRQERPDDLLTRVAEARLDLDAGRVDEAARTLRVVSGELARADVLRMLAVAETRRGDYAAALTAASRAIEVSPLANPFLYRHKLRLQAQLRDWNGVTETLRQMRAEGLPYEATERLAFAQALYETGRSERARQPLAPLLQQEPPDSSAALMVAQYEAATRPDEVRALMQRLLAAGIEHHAAVGHLVRVEQFAGHPERALARIDAAGPREELPAWLRLIRAQLLVELERLEEAEVDARAAFSAEPSPSGSAALLTGILHALGRSDAAIAEFEAAHKQGRLRPIQLWLLGTLYLDGKRYVEARSVLEEALEKAPGMNIVRNDLAYVLAELGSDLDRALQLASEAKSAMPDNAAVSDTLGYVYYRRGILEPALVEFRSAVAQAQASGGEQADYHYHMALALQALGRNEEALRALDRALALDPQHQAAKQRRAELAAAPPASNAGS